jgi:hypothetical protein
LLLLLLLRARIVNSLEIGEKMDAIRNTQYGKRHAARMAAENGTMTAEDAEAAISAADAEAAAAQAQAEAEGDAAAAKRSDEVVNEIYERENMCEFESRLIDDERAGILEAVVALPMLRHLNWSLQVSFEKVNRCLLLV